MRTANLFCISTAALLALCSPRAAAQNSTASPYSMYGIGLLSPKEDACAAGLGHSAVALAPSEWVNISNPAGLGGLDSLTFYFNIQLKAFHDAFKTDNERYSTNSANIDAISMGFRGRRWFAMAFGYAPYSQVGYNLVEEKHIIGQSTKYQVNYKGSGGVQQAFIDGCFTFFDHLSIGANFSMLWGSVTRREVNRFSQVIGGEDITNTFKYTMNNIFWELGIQGNFNIGKNNFRLGALYNKKTFLYSSYDQIVSNSVSSELMHDDESPLRDNFHVPASYTAGLTYSRGIFLATGQFKYDEWSKINVSKYGDNISYRDAYTISGGVQLSPGQRDMPFYKRMRYRLGGFYSKDYVKMVGVNLQDYGVTAGLSIPIGRSANYINIAYEYMKRGTIYNGLVEETYNTFKVAFNVHEIWFVKSKFD